MPRMISRTTTSIPPASGCGSSGSAAAPELTANALAKGGSALEPPFSLRLNGSVTLFRNLPPKRPALELHGHSPVLLLHRHLARALAAFIEFPGPQLARAGPAHLRRNTLHQRRRLAPIAPDTAVRRILP